jgi:hypothetical protein
MIPLEGGEMRPLARSASAAELETVSLVRSPSRVGGLAVDPRGSPRAPSAPATPVTRERESGGLTLAALEGADSGVTPPRKPTFCQEFNSVVFEPL